MNIFQIPVSKNEQPQKFVAVIDSSGSQHGHWQMLAKSYNQYAPQNKTTITFSDDALMFTDDLSMDLKKYGGDHTNVIKGF